MSSTQSQMALQIEKQRSITTRWQQEAYWQITDLAPEKGDEAKKQAPGKEAQQKLPQSRMTGELQSWSPEPEESIQT
jgi:hypothetical protein